GDVVHLAVCIPRYRWYQRHGQQVNLVRQYGIAIPTGWTAVGSYTSNNQYNVNRQGIIFLIRKVATGAEGSDVTIPISRTDYRPEVIADGEVIQVAAALVAHRGVSSGSPYASPPVFKLGGDAPWNSGESALSRLAQLAFAVGIDPNNADPEVGDPFPAWDDPTTTKGEPASWDVLAQESTQAVETTSLYGHSGEPADTQTLNVRAAALDADTFTPGLAFFGLPPKLTSVNVNRWYRVAFALRDESEGPSVDQPPAPGQPGVTGSGWTQPEWDGAERQIDTPLLCTVWGEGVGSYGAELQLLLDEDEAPQPVGLDATFNALGACTSAQATFAASPGVLPYEHVLKFTLRLTTDGSGDGVDWWAGVVRNVRYDNGLYIVDLEGLWSLLNDARVQLDSNGDIDRPQHGVIEGTLVLGVGDPTAVVIESEADEQQTWSEHLNNTFRATPEAAWGIGPDQVFIMGLPDQGGVLELDADHEAVAAVDAGEFILPPFVTEWWAEASDGSVVSAELTPSPGLLVPSRLAQSRLDDYGNLLTPKEAMYPIYTGPSHTLEYAGIAVPPLRVVNLPSGESQMVASARVSITVGEEGSMPRVTTTLTTVALPYESRGAV